jgi:hypothetical protein
MITKKRVHTKIGDVFSVNIDERNKKYFQLIAFDLTQLNSDVIRGFKALYPINANLELSEITQGEVAFYAHCVTKFGVKMNLWEKAGNIIEVGKIEHILFRDSGDYGNPQIQISQDWWVWRINDKGFTKIGKLEGENREAEIGIIVNPYDIVDRIKTGKYNFVYPCFE